MTTDVLELDRPAATPLHFHVHLPRTAGSALQRGAEPEDLGQETRGNGFHVLRSGASGGLLGREPVNRTTSGELAVSPADRRLLASRLGADLAAYASIEAAFPARRRWFGAFRR